MKLKLKSKCGQHVVENLEESSKISELLQEIRTFAGINEEEFVISHGYPPKPLYIEDKDLSLCDYNIQNGDLLIISEKIPYSSTSKPEIKERKHNMIEMTNQVPIMSDPDGSLLKKVVPADNSCLFTSINYCLAGKYDPSCVPNMRRIVADCIQNSDEFCEALLGKSVAEYCEWIKKEDSWGGGIEVAVLADYYNIEICVVDTPNCIISRFGEDKNYAKRILIMYDGIHYDSLYLEASKAGVPIQTIFASRDLNILVKAEELANEAKLSGQYTDVKHFKLKCRVCNQHFKNTVEAESHAKQTAHSSFSEIRQ